MKLFVDKMPRDMYVEEDCIFAELTGNKIGGKGYSYLDECKCKISGYTCSLQRYDECPYLKEFNKENRI